jgi:hypothetical protein
MQDRFEIDYYIDIANALSQFFRSFYIPHRSVEVADLQNFCRQRSDRLIESIISNASRNASILRFNHIA